MNNLGRVLHKIRTATENFPEEDGEGCGYWHMHVPAGHSKSFSKEFKRRCMQTLIDRAFHLSRMKPESRRQIHVVAAISLPAIEDSQIIVFFGKAYFRGFFNRNAREQTWVPLNKIRSLSREWQLILPTLFVEKGYRESIDEDGYQFEGEQWFVGELK